MQTTQSRSKKQINGSSNRATGVRTAAQRSPKIASANVVQFKPREVGTNAPCKLALEEFLHQHFMARANAQL